MAPPRLSRRRRIAAASAEATRRRLGTRRPLAGVALAVGPMQGGAVRVHVHVHIPASFRVLLLLLLRLLRLWSP